MKVFTFDTPGGGVLALQHHRFDKPDSGPPWDLDLRASIRGARITGRQDDTAAEQIGHWVIGREDYGDLTGALLWSREKTPAGRPQNAFAFAFPAIVVRHDDLQTTFGRGGDVAVKVLRRPWEADDRLATLKTDHAPTMNRPPAGSIGIVLAAQEESEQLELFISPQTQAALIAPWRGGAYEHGTIVYDLDEKGALDPIKNGRIQHHLRVTHAEGEWQPSINMSATGKSPGGHGLCWWAAAGDDKSVVAGAAAKGIAAWLSVEMGGPLHPGHPTKDKHRAGTNADGEPTQPVHVNIDALFYQDELRDGPKEHGPDYPDVEPTDWPHLTHVYEGFDKRRGRWRRWTSVPLSRPVPFIPKRPPDDEPPVPVPKLPDPVPHPIPHGGLGIGQPTDPSQGVGSPAMLGVELGLPSLSFTGTRHRDSQAGQGLYGEPGSDIALPPLAFARPAASDETTASAEPETFSPIENEFRGRSRRRKAFEADNNGLPYSLSKEALDRGGPAPLSAHIFALPSVSNGAWDYKALPGQGHGHGTAAAAGLVIAPGGVLGDGPDDQSAWAGKLAVLAYGGQFGGTPASLGIGSYDQIAGDWYDGAVLSLDGAAGARNMRLDFRDDAGVARVGTFSHFGHFTPGTDSAHALGTAAVRWSTLHADNVGALSAPADAGFFTAASIGALTLLASTPAEITTDLADVAIAAGASVLRFTADTDGHAISGFVGTAGRVIVVMNVDASDNFVLKHEDSASAAANRMSLPYGLDLTVEVGNAITLWYDGTSSRWRAIGQAIAP